MNEESYNSFSNFWIEFDSELCVIGTSEALKSYFKLGEKFLSQVKMMQPFLHEGQTSAASLLGRILFFKAKSMSYSLRGSVHNLTNNYLLIAWPNISSFKEVKELDIETLIQHPNCNVLDVLIIKEVLTKQKDKVEQSLRKEIKLLENINTLEDINKQKTIFLANMSHEIRSPLNLIVGLSNILNEMIDIPEKKELITKIIHASNHLGDLVSDILDISKIEGGIVEVENSSVDLKETLEDLKQINQVSLLDKGSTINIDYEEEVPAFIMTDKIKLKQIVQNLLSNACKFCAEDSEISITVSYNAQRLIIKVANLGPEISLARRTAIFDKFVQEDSSITKKYGGTGLGLALSKTLANVMGGDLILDESFKNGSRFILELTAPIANELHSDDDSLKIKKQNTSFKSVLIIDDDESNILILAHYLKEYNFDIDSALSGSDAISFCKQKQYDLIFCDMQMPETSGVKTVSLIREIEKSREDEHSIIIAQSANAFVSDQKMMLNAGSDFFITKPINKVLLSKLIDKILNR